MPKGDTGHAAAAALPPSAHLKPGLHWQLPPTSGSACMTPWSGHRATLAHKSQLRQPGEAQSLLVAHATAEQLVGGFRHSQVEHVAEKYMLERPPDAEQPCVPPWKQMGLEAGQAQSPRESAKAAPAEAGHAARHLQLVQPAVNFRVLVGSAAGLGQPMLSDVAACWTQTGRAAGQAQAP